MGGVEGCTGGRQPIATVIVVGKRSVANHAQVLEKWERKDEVENLRKWKGGRFRTEGFDNG